MKVRTDFVPVNCDYLTAGKEYEAKSGFGFEEGVFIINDDEGDSIQIIILCCNHIQGRHWQVVEEKPFDINKHKFTSDGVEDATYTKECGLCLDLDDQRTYCYINKQDAIAIAIALGVTGNDL